MKRAILILCAAVATLTVSAQYRPDFLPGFEQLTIDQPNGEQGEKIVTTLVRHTPLEGVNRAVLYVHGYNDYFFQEEMAAKFVAEGWQFYAVDLRRYGRSMREWHTPFAVLDIAEYFADIDAAIDVMQSEGMEEIVLVAHSTGGLTTPLYCHENRANLRVDALILNSPFFDMNLESGFMEGVGSSFASSMGSIFKEWTIQKGNNEAGGYARSISDKYDGEWSFDTQFKRVESLPITAGWFRAIHRAQRQLQKGLEIPCPVLVLYSDNSVWGEYRDEYMSGDSVLDVADIAKYAPAIGHDVTQIEVKGGLHDLVLSRPEVRYPLYEEIFSWLDEQF